MEVLELEFIYLFLELLEGIQTLSYPGSTQLGNRFNFSVEKSVRNSELPPI